MDRPSTVELVVAVHRVAAAEPNQHGFGPARDAQDFMAENEIVGLVQRLKRPFTVFDDFADQGFSDAVGGATYLGAFRHVPFSRQLFFEGVFDDCQEFSQS